MAKTKVSEYHEALPENAEIVVDYAKPVGKRVTFSYPVKRTYLKALLHGGLLTYIVFWMVTGAIPSLLVFIFTINIGNIPTIANFTSREIALAFNPNSLPNEHWWSITYYGSKENPTSSYTIRYGDNYNATDIYYNYPTSSTFGNVDWYSMSAMVLIIFGIPLLAVLTTARDKKKLARCIPRMNLWMVSVFGRGRENKLKIFKPKDVVNRTAIISYFNNVFIDWKPTQDFKAYLTKVEIKTIKNDFIYYKRKGKFKKSRVNEYDFTASFRFSRTPKKGQMRVLFY